MTILQIPHVNITPIPDTAPPAIPSLWNDRYSEIDANFGVVQSNITDVQTSVSTVHDSITVIQTNGISNGWIAINAAADAAISTGYLCDTSTAAFSLTLPASPAVGNVIGVCDMAGKFATNNLTIARNGKLIMGLSEDMVVSTNNISFQLIYSGDTYGWRVF